MTPFTAACGLGACATAAAVAAAAPAPVLRAPEERITVQRVLLPVRVRPDWKRPGACAGLRPDELRVFEDDVPATAVDQVEEGWRPTLHLLLLDVSGSMKRQHAFVLEAARRYLARLEADERASVFAVGDSLTMRTEITPDRERLRLGVDDAREETASAIWDALVQLTTQFVDDPGRKVLIVVTDGVDTGSLATFEEALAATSSVPELSIFAVVPTAPVRGTDDAVALAARDRMQALTRATGGELFLVANPAFLSRTFLAIRTRLRTEIFVHYAPPRIGEEDEEPSVRKVRVDLAPGREGCRVAPARGTRLAGRRAQPSAIPAPAPDADAAPPPLGEGCAGPPELRVDENRVSGCVVDAVVDHGLAWDPVAARPFFRKAARLALRRIDIPLSPIASLPRSPAELVRRWLVEDVSTEVLARRSLLPSGTAWLALRRRLGVAMREASPEYEAWLEGLLARDATRQVAITRRALRARGYAPEAIEVEASSRRLEAEAHASQPTSFDAQEGLAAWLGDAGARDLALEVERIAIQRWLGTERGKEEGERIVARWDRIHALFPLPLERRVVALPSPILDEPTGRIGYFRVVLPVPTLLAEHAWAIRRGLPDRPPDDRVPRAPFALALLRDLRDDPRLRDGATGPGVRLERFGHTEAASETDPSLHRVWIELRGPALGKRGLRIAALARTTPEGATTFEEITVAADVR